MEPFHLAPSVSGALGTVTWSVASGTLPDGLNLDAFRGDRRHADDVGVTAVVQTGRGSLGTQSRRLDTVTITVAPAPIQIVTSALPAGVVRLQYDAALIATGGTGSQTWSLVGGLLPARPPARTNGSVTGVPESIGRFHFTVQVKDDWPGYTDSGMVTSSLLRCRSHHDRHAAVRRCAEAVSGLLEFTGGTGPTTWSLVEGQLPKGLELSPDGIISSKPRAVGVLIHLRQATWGGTGNVASARSA